MTTADLCLPGDCLLYKPSSIFGKLIAVKTWHQVSHVEVYDGNGCSWASRDGKGVNRYPCRNSELTHILRPTVPIDIASARAYGRSMVGTPYGWLDLAAFLGIAGDHKGIVCSPFVTEWYRHGGFNPFPGEASNAIAPFEFLLVRELVAVNGPVGV